MRILIRGAAGYTMESRLGIEGREVRSPTEGEIGDVKLMKE